MPTTPLAAPLFSIIIPVYNCADWLDIPLQSLIQQTESSWEAICVNDGSQDDSWQRLESWAARDERIKVFSQPNAGVSAARNTALSQATGEYILLLDADDALDADALRLLHEAQQKNPGSMVVFGVRRIFSNPEKKSIDQGCYAHCPEACPHIRKTDSQTIFRMHAYGVNKLYSRALIVQQHIRFPDGVPLNEDLIFFLENAYHYKSFHCIAQSLYMYYERESSVCVQLKKFDRPIKHYTNLVTLFIPFMQKLNQLPLCRRYPWQMGLYMRIIQEKRAQMRWMHELGIERPELEEAMDQAAAEFKKVTPLPVLTAVLIKARYPRLYRVCEWVLSPFVS